MNDFLWRSGVVVVALTVVTVLVKLGERRERRLSRADSVYRHPSGRAK